MKMSQIQIFRTFIERLSKREKIIFYAVIFFISLSLLDRIIISPIYSKMKTLNEEIQEKESNIKKNIHILSQKDKISAEINKYASFLSSLKLEDGQLISILKEIETLANKNSVYLVDMKPVGLKDLGSLKKYLVNLNCEAQMEQLAEFMYTIEISNRLLTIEKYQINPKSKESSIARCSMLIAKIATP